METVPNDNALVPPSNVQNPSMTPTADVVPPLRPCPLPRPHRKPRSHGAIPQTPSTTSAAVSGRLDLGGWGQDFSWASEGELQVYHGEGGKTRLVLVAVYIGQRGSGGKPWGPHPPQAPVLMQCLASVSAVRRRPDPATPAVPTALCADRAQRAKENDTRAAPLPFGGAGGGFQGASA